MERDHLQYTALLPGMYVRVPFDTDRSGEDFRNFRIGQIRSIDNIASTGLIAFEHPASDNETPREVESPLTYLDRCRILPNTPFTTIHGKRSGLLLLHCDDQWTEGEYLEYYVIFDGEKTTEHLSEAEIRVSSIRQNPDPIQQLRRYEFQNPIWKSLRDQVVESYNVLHNTTFGVEDLVGSRIRLLAHQAEVVARVLSDLECRYILADEVGLGKTIEACVILRGLLRRDKQLRALIIVPSSLAQQWHNELDSKFWLDFPILSTDKPLSGFPKSSGYIVCQEDLVQQTPLWHSMRRIEWGLIITDEAHNLRKHPSIYERVYQLSAAAKRVLILSATPIQRRAKEYLKLLALMNPHKYKLEDEEAFLQTLKMQRRLLHKVAQLSQMLTIEDFDAEEFEEECESVIRSLKHDRMLHMLWSQFTTNASTSMQGLQQAHEIVAYLSENYQIERRVLRNRRVHLALPLPERQLDTSYSYIPDKEEVAVLSALFDYIEDYNNHIEVTPLTAEYCRILMHAAASSPQALLHVIKLRETQLYTTPEISISEDFDPLLITFTTPRQEMERISHVIISVPSFNNEIQSVNSLTWGIQTWLEHTEATLQSLSIQHGELRDVSANRLAQVFLALDQILRNRGKAIVFSSWQPTLDALLPYLQKRHGSKAIAQFNSRLDMEQLQDAADRFQTADTCRMLLCDELGGEGRNFQIASHIVHLDLPWTPAQLEQRLGRVDRLGREGAVISIVPFAQDWPEHDLFRIWQEAFHLFTQSMSGLEIALEGIQDTLLDAIVNDVQNGLGSLIQGMTEQATKLHQTIEEERYFEEGALNRRQRDEFRQISETYSDGKKLRFPLLRWADLIGLNYEYDTVADVLTFSPRRFEVTKLKNAKFFQPPNMEEALRRSRRQRDLVIRGTFNRDIAVLRENLVFFAPSSDPWTDTWIANALEADRGRCCAIQRSLPDLGEVWEGFELFYTLTVHPRPLYKAGYDPSHLYRAQGFLRTPIYRLLVSADGQIEKRGSPIWKAITQNSYQASRDIHLGRREEHWKGATPQIQAFKQRYPHDEWEAIINTIIAVAEQKLTDELEFMEDEAGAAKEEFVRYAAGLRASALWLQHISGNVLSRDYRASQDYERSSEGLVEGLRHPLCQLESICFWRLVGTANDE